jgi:hypothetical protein|tara:strand:+ start:859 stop:1029 length:171 start_codon:yes stop_codon:yes gene_type:complete
MAEQTIRFEKEQDKKYSIRYKELVPDDRAAVIGTLYVQKWFAQGSNLIDVTVKSVK